MLGDKTTNVYQVCPDEYKNLQENSIMTHYQKANSTTELEINKEAKEIAAGINLAERIDKLSHNESYITLKDHKINIQNNPKVRLINPAKTQIGKISKTYIEQINVRTLELSNLFQWKSTIDVIDWFQRIKKK